jgi:hypothetical protein
VLCASTYKTQFGDILNSALKRTCLERQLTEW